MRLRELQEELKSWLAERGLNEDSIDKWVQLAITVEEVGEAAAVISKGKGDINEEIADIIIATTCLGISLGVDIETAIQNKLRVLEGRKPYDVDGHIRITHE